MLSQPTVVTQPAKQPATKPASQLITPPNKPPAPVSTATPVSVAAPVVTPAVPPPSQSELLQAALEKFVSVVDAPDGSHFTCIGTCLKCGWQTMQINKYNAFELVRQHVSAHWRDVTNVIKVGG